MLESEQNGQQLERRLSEVADQPERTQAEAAKLGRERSNLLTDHQAQLEAAKEEKAKKRQPWN